MNNKGFAITTVLYGTFILFLLLMVTMLAIAANYKSKMELLIDHSNGARAVVDLYNKSDLFLMELEGRKYYKVNPGVAIIGYMFDGSHTGPLLISKNKNAVIYSTDCTYQQCIYESEKDPYSSYDPSKKRTYHRSDNYIIYKNTKYYYSSGKLWMAGNKDATNLVNPLPILPKYGGATGLSREAAVKKAVEQLIKYYEIAT